MTQKDEKKVSIFMNIQPDKLEAIKEFITFEQTTDGSYRILLDLTNLPTDSIYFEEYKAIFNQKIEEQKEAFESGKYYTYRRTDEELIFIVDGIEQRTRYAAQTDHEEIAEKSRKLKTRTLIYYSFYKIFKSAQDVTPKQLQELLEKDFLKVTQDKHTNILSRLLFMQPSRIDMNGTALIEKDDVTLYVRNWKTLLTRTSAIKLLDFFVFYITANNSYDKQTVSIPIEDYMKIRGLKDTKDNRYSVKKQLEEDMALLASVSIKWKLKRNLGEKNDKGKYELAKGDFHEVDLAGEERGCSNGMITFEFSRRFMESLPQKQYMYLPQKAFSTDDAKYVHSYQFIRRMMEHKRVNVGEENENIITGKTLIESSKELEKHITCEPKYFKRLILEPFEKNMNYLEEHCLCEWSYADTELTPDGEYNQSKIPTNIRELLKAKIVFEIEEYPKKKMKKLIENKEKFAAANQDIKKLKRQKKKLETAISEIVSEGTTAISEIVSEATEVVEQLKEVAKKTKKTVKSRVTSH